MTNYVKHKMRSKKVICVIGWVILGIMAAIAFAMVLGYGLMYLWNWLMPDIFGLTTVTYWQAVGILVLSKLLFGGFGGHGGKKHNGRRRGNCRKREQQSFRGDFGRWQHYDKFWQEEGEKAYLSYLERTENEHKRGNS